MAPLDYGYAINSEFGRNKSVKILVNPGGSMKWKLLDWDGWKTMIPKSAVYIDKKERCKNIVTAYIDCSDCRDDKLIPSQRTNDGGYVYYVYNKKTRYDNNEYQILIESGITKYEILSLELEESLAVEDVKTIVSSASTSVVINKSSVPVPYEKSLTLAATQSSSWDHSIHWEVGIGVEVKVVGKIPFFAEAETTMSINAKFGHSYGWGGSEESSTSSTDVARGQVPGNHGVKIQMTAKKTQKDVPYKAKVRLTYDDGTTKTGKKVIICFNKFAKVRLF